MKKQSMFLRLLILEILLFVFMLWQGAEGINIAEAFENCLQITCTPPPGSNCCTDFSNDGKVNLTDMGLWKTQRGRTDCNTNPCTADANDDGKVTLQDLVLLRQEFGRTNCMQP